MRGRIFTLLALLCAVHTYVVLSPGSGATAHADRTPPPRALLEPRPGERKKAVERILEVELSRLQTAVELNVARMSLPQRLRSKAPTTEEIMEEMDSRGPIIRWGVSRWLIDSLGIEKYGVWCPTLKRLELHPWQWTPKAHPTLTTPTLVQSLVKLRPTLTRAIKKGFRSSPLRVCRLAYHGAVVYLLAALSNLPGPQRKLIQRTWPRLVEHLATTLELNHERILSAPPVRGVQGLLQGRPRNWVQRIGMWARSWRGERESFA